METKTNIRITNLVFKSQEKVKSPSFLLDFSENYKEELKKIASFLKQNEGKFIPLFFTRILPNGTMQEKREFLGIPRNISEKGFDFYSSWNISASILTDDEVKNEIVLSNILGVLPTLGIIPKEEILEIKHDKISQEYFKYWEKTKKLLYGYLNTEHHIEIHLSNDFVIEGKVLEINKSNLLIFCNRERKNQLQNGGYVYVNIIPHERFLYFFSSDYFIHKIKIKPWQENINPYDED